MREEAKQPYLTVCKTHFQNLFCKANILISLIWRLEQNKFDISYSLFYSALSDNPTGGFDYRNKSIFLFDDNKGE